MRFRRPTSSDRAALEALLAGVPAKVREQALMTPADLSVVADSRYGATDEWSVVAAILFPPVFPGHASGRGLALVFSRPATSGRKGAGSGLGETLLRQVEDEAARRARMRGVPDLRLRYFPDPYRMSRVRHLRAFSG